MELPPRSLFCKRRVITIFCYLNDVEEGGETCFPEAGIKVKPKAGRAVVFSNIRANHEPDPRTVHAGEPPIKGVKYGLNIWICED